MGQQTRQQLAYVVERMRLQGQYKLPPERELAGRLGVSRGALRKELGQLVQDGQIEQRVGRAGGSFIRKATDSSYVSEPEEPVPFTVSRSLNSVVGVPTFLAGQGFEPSTRILFAEEREALPHERHMLELERHRRVVVIRRLRSANSVPLSLEEMTLPSSVFPDILKRDLGSIYELMADVYETAVQTAEEAISIGHATPAAAYLLQVAPGVPLFDIRRTAFDSDTRPIEVSRDLFRSDMTKLTVTSK